jgi:hypothetical protein
MADLKISQLTGATTPLAGTEVVPVVQSSSTKKVSIANLTAGRAVTMLSNTMVSASAVNDVDKTGGSGYGYRIKGEDQSNVRFRFENINGRTWELIGGYAGANNDFFSILDVTGSATRFSIDATGNIRADTGNFVVATAGKGIDFSANTHATGMTTETLTWYEEGTWTPTITDGTLSVNGDSSRYSRVGKKVFVNFSFYAKDISGLAAFPTQLFLGALPFSVAVGFEPGIATANITSNLPVQVAGLNGSSRAYLFSGYSGPDSVILYTAAFTNPASISLSGTFTYTTS